MPSPTRVRAAALLASLCTLVTACLVTGCLDNAASAGAAPVHAAAVTQPVLYGAGTDGYTCFRIPSLVHTNDAIIAVAEGRRNDCGDAGDIDIVAKRSTDGGKTWSALYVVNRGGGDTHGNPEPIWDAVAKRIVLITTYNAGRTDGKGCATPCNRTIHQQVSTDDGLTWSTPTDITSQAKDPAWTAWYATGPNHGIQLVGGAHAGRLVFGFNAEDASGTTSVSNHAGLVYSDDHGASWHIGAVSTFPHPVGSTYTQKPSELSLTQRADGSIYAAGREQGGTDVGTRDYAISTDGGASFSTDFRTIPDLVAPQVEGSVLHVDRTGSERMIIALPSDTDQRERMMIRSSTDGGVTWQDTDHGTLITSTMSAYSDLVQISPSSQTNATIGLLYEQGVDTPYENIRFATFSESDIATKNATAPTTPDVSPVARGATVLGGATLGTGRYGKALTLDGNDDYARVAYSPSRLLGAGDFTVSTWIDYGSSSANQAVFWLGGMNSAPQLWLRAEPGNHRLIALMTAASPALNTYSVETTSAYNDQKWHHVALTRSGSTLTLYVDGAKSDSTAVAGSITQTVAWQLVIGQRLDGAYHFAGSIDDTRVYNRALSAGELTQVRTANTDITSGEVLRLPFDSLVTS